METQSNSKLFGNFRQSTAKFAVMALCLLGAIVPVSAQAATVTLNVVSARNEPLHTVPGPIAPIAAPVIKGASISSFKYLINIDNTGTTTQRSPADGCSPLSPGYPGSCKWTSIAGSASSSPIYTQGDQGDFPNASTGLNLPDGRYLISVLADGYKLDGRHFTVSGNSVKWEGKAAGDPATEVKVELQPFPLPDAQIQAAVFEDISPVNSAPDLPAEHGLAGFQGHIMDYLGEVTTDLYGAPLCGTGVCLSACYVVSGGIDLGTVPPVDVAGRCPVITTALMDMTLPNGSKVKATAGDVVEGKIKIPNLGPNRYTLSVTPPNGSGWIQTTTLEGNHDWDAWVMEGATGLDTEFIVAGEPFPAIIFGYVPVQGTPSAVTTGPTGDVNVLPALTGSGSITGVVDAVKIYVPTTGGVGGLPGAIWGGLQGAKIDKPIPYPWVTLTSLGNLVNSDTVVWVGQGDANGKFTIPNVPAGTYTLTWWDEPQNQILDLVNVTVGTGEAVDMGILPLSGWWTFFDGYVFTDTNSNGIKDPGEPGIAGYTLTMRKRENSLMDRGTTIATTDANGYYKFEAAYPMTQWLVMEAYDDLHYTTGVTYQADNQPTPTTHLGAGVDVSVHPIIGLSGRLDWGKRSYDATGRNGIDPRNGGIVGSITYDTTRNELDPRYAAAEDWQPGIPDLPVNLYATVPAAANCVRQPAPPGLIATCDSSGRYAVGLDGSITKGQLLNTYISETWQRPTGCVARGVDGAPMVHGTDEQVLPLGVDDECIEAPLMGIQFGTYPTDQGTSAANFGAAVNGNYGFGEGCFVSLSPVVVPGVFTPSTSPTGVDTSGCTLGTMQPLPGGRDYLVEVAIPKDVLNRPIYQVTREDDINIGNGDDFVPAVPPPACAGPLHTVHVTNPTFLDIGGSPYEGMALPLCDTKLVTLANGKSVVPMFNLFTEVPIPGRHWFIVIDDLNFSSNPKSTTFGEKAGMPFVPVGIYDYTDRLVTTVESDYNGLADVLLPSTNRINCPTPSGVCGNLYRYVGNDPGVPGRLNPNFNPLFRTISAEFEILPGLIVPADLAPTQVGVAVQLPGGQTTSPVSCRLDDATPQLFAVSRPYVSGTGADRQFTIKGKGFGTSGQVTLDNVAVTATFGAIDALGASTINVTVPTEISVGPKQLKIVAANGQTTVNGLTLHVLGAGYSPTIFEVGPGKTYSPAETLPAVADHAIQRALDAAPAGALVVVYPNNDTAATNPRQNPRGAYYENLIISKSVKLQGVGPGSPDGSVKGSIIDGAAFAGDSPVAADWYTRIATQTAPDAAGNAVPTWGGNSTIFDGAVISLYLPSSGGNAFPTGGYVATTAPSIDGFDLRGGDQQGFPGNINAIGGGRTGLPAGQITQGGAIFANAYANNLQITNNVVQNNGGAYGTIRIGTPDLPDPDSHNANIVIAHNRVVTNAGTNQAGGIGLFSGSNNYQVASNDICGNFSSEYGGGVSAVGYSPGGSIHHNRIYFNRSFDEGGGIMIAGGLPAVTNTLSPGSGPVDIYNNLIQGNLSNDDGGGIRFLMAGNYPMNVYNNFIVNNISTHEGGGIAINDAPNVRVFNNTIMKNLTTATALTSSGAAAPAGLSTSVNSSLLQATLPVGSPLFSNPLLFNNIFWDNRAGTRGGSAVTGLGNDPQNLSVCTTLPGCDHWDLGVADGAFLLAPTNSIVQQNAAIRPYTPSSSNSTLDPQVIAQYDVGVTFNTWRNNPAFLGAIMISADLPPNLLGNYHIPATGSPALDLGAANKAGINAPAIDIDGQARPAGVGYDAGADEYSTATVGSTANLSIVNTNGVTNVTAGTQVIYKIVVTNASTTTVANGALVTDIMPASLTNVTWLCNGTVATCGGPVAGSGNISRFVNLGTGQSLTFTVKADILSNATGTLVNTATVGAPGSVTDPDLANNTATDSDPILALPSLPILNLRDNFNRANSNTLNGNAGFSCPAATSNWSQVCVPFLGASLRTNANQASDVALPGWAMWNGAGSAAGATQSAAFTFVNATLDNSFLILKGSGGSANTPANYIRVQYTSGAVTVATTNNGNTLAPIYLTRATFPTTFANGDTLTARANATGTVLVWKTSTGGVTTYVGGIAVPTADAVTTPWTQGTGAGRMGMGLPVGARVDNFSGS